MTAKQIEEEIRNFFGDTRRPAAETKAALEGLSELAQELADAINGGI